MYSTFNSLFANDGPVRQGYRTVDCGLDGPVRQGNFRYALDRYSAFVMLSSMRAAIAVASLYDVTISATESQFGQKANCKIRLNAAY